MKKIIISATSDLVTDQRVHKVAQSCVKHGYEVLVVGRKKRDSLPVSQQEYSIKRFRLWFEKGALFYANYNLRLFFFLLFHKADAYIANDLDTLAANYFAAKLKGIPLLYDNHEYFTGVPELLERPFVRNFWKAIERFIFPKLRYVYTVNDSLKELFEKEYKINVGVVRNMPLAENQDQQKSEASLPTDKRIIIYQGAVNKDRGIEEAIDAMQYLDGIRLFIIGDGDIMKEVQDRVKALHLDDKVTFTGKLPFDKLSAYTIQAELGLCIEKDTNINYRYSLPNKLFDYIHAGIPILASRLVEVEKIINAYNIGLFIENHTPEHIALQIKHGLDNLSRPQWSQNLAMANAQLNWETEEKVFLSMLAEALKKN